MNNKKVKGKSLFKVIFLAGLLLSASFFPANAQDDKQAKIKVSPEEAKAVKKIESAKTLAEKIKTTDEFIKKYPQSPARRQAADYIAEQILQTKDDSQIIQNSRTYLTIFTDPAEADIIMPSVISSYVALKQYKDAFAAADKYLARHPEDVFARLQLAIEGSNMVRTGTKDYAAVSRDYARQAIELIEANKKPAEVDDAKWAEYQTKWLPQLYQSAGIFEFDKGNSAQAVVNFEKAVKLSPNDLNSWILLGTISDNEYQDLAQRYNITPAGAARDALLTQANTKMDQTIELFARIVALSDGRPEAKQINEQIRQNLEQYYKYRHKNLDGLNDLIGKYKK